MKEYIEREAAIAYIKENQCKGCSDIGLCGKCAVLAAMKLFESIPAADVVEVVRCGDCKHRPEKPEKYDDGFDLAFPDEVCPCYCDGDPFYSRYPEDDWFCPNGESKGGDE